MTQVQKLFLAILSASLKPECQEQSKELSKLLEKTSISWQALCQIAKEQALSLLLYDYILTYSFEILTKEEQKKIQNQVMTAAVMYYHMVNFVFKVLSLAKQEGISCCILKGIGLSAYYPKEELRKTGDVDLYIPNLEEWERFCKILKSQGFKQEKTIADHHISFFYIISGIRFELEVHKRPINRQENKEFNKEIDKIFASFANKNYCNFSEIMIMNGTIPVLPIEENIFYLLLHMLQHFLSGGMGLRMLYDWVVIWRKKGQEPNFCLEKYLSFIRQSKIEGFHYMVTGLCITFLGLSLQEVPWMEGHMPRKEVMDLFLNDIFHGGEFGEKDTSRMLILLEKPRFFVYLKEFHRQMQLRFQKAGKFPILWPFLWLASFVIFFYNNKFLRKTSLSQILKDTEERSRLLEEITLFKK